MFIDSHCHLNLMDLSNFPQGIDQVVQQARANQVNYLLNISVDLATFPEVLATAKRYPDVYASCGVHPNEPLAEELTAAALNQYACDSKVVGIGETGLDYFHKTVSVQEQHRRFQTHIAVSKALAKPLIIHTRDAEADTLAIMREHTGAIAGVMHCFTGSLAMAQACLEMGFYISFSGIITFKNANELREVVKQVPLDRILIETDAPYLAPVPHRGLSNQPAWVIHVAQAIANIRSCTIEQVAQQTSKNFFTLFSIT